MLHDKSLGCSFSASKTADIFGYFLPLFQTGQRGDHGKMWGSVGAFQPTGSSVPFPDIQVSKSYHMYAQTTEGFPPTFPATINSVLSRHTRALPTRRVALNNGENACLLLIQTVSIYFWSANLSARDQSGGNEEGLMATSCNLYTAPEEADGSFL